MQEPNDDQWTMLRWDDHIVPILQHPDIHIRDKALLVVAWESHARRGELLNLRFGDVEDRGDHLAILLTHPTGRDRSLVLVGSMPYLKRWMVHKEHPVAERLAEDADPLEEAPSDTPVWTYINSNKDTSLLSLRAITGRACQRGDVPKEFTLYDIRRSRAKMLAHEFGLGSALRQRFGWASHKPEEFVELDEEPSPDGEIKPSTPIRCSNCGAWTPRHQPCIWCDSDC